MKDFLSDLCGIFSVPAFGMFLLFSFSSASADTCVNCHTSIEKLKTLAPSQKEPPKKLSEGEG